MTRPKQHPKHVAERTTRETHGQLRSVPGAVPKQTGAMESLKFCSCDIGNYVLGSKVSGIRYQASRPVDVGSTLIEGVAVLISRLGIMFSGRKPFLDHLELDMRPHLPYSLFPNLGSSMNSAFSITALYTSDSTTPAYHRTTLGWLSLQSFP